MSRYKWARAIGEKWSGKMRFSDVWLLGKKIFVGVIVTVVPLAILTGGLWITQHFVGHPAHAKQTSTREVTYAN